jgi:AcrR family transcriptional regulator
VGGVPVGPAVLARCDAEALPPAPGLADRVGSAVDGAPPRRRADVPGAGAGAEDRRPGLAEDAVGGAGLPAGSTSNYFRTREALIRSIIGRLGALDRADWHRLAEADRPEDLHQLADSLANFVRFAIGPGRDRTLARYALCLEAAVRPELQVELGRGNAELQRWAVPWLRQAGSSEPEWHCRLILDHLDGVILHQLAFPNPGFDPGPGIRLVLRGMVPAAA